MIAEYEDVFVLTDLPDKRLRAGDIGTVVDIHADGAGCVVEFMNAAGETVAVPPLLTSEVRPVTGADMLAARTLDVPVELAPETAAS